MIFQKLRIFAENLASARAQPLSDRRAYLFRVILAAGFIAAINMVDLGAKNFKSLLQSGMISQANAQDEAPSKDSRPGWVSSFDDVKTEKIKPADLPPTPAPGSSTGLKTTGAKLPKPASEQELRAQARAVAPKTLRVVALHTPPRPYRQQPMLYFGHAVWVEAPKSESKPAEHKENRETDEELDKPAKDTRSSALLSSYDWLENADKVYALPTDIDVDKKTSAGLNLTPAAHVSVSDMSGQKSAQAWLKKNQDDLLELKLHQPDRHRNLVELRGESAELNAPDEGLTLFDSSGSALYRLYGFSQYAGEFLSAVQIKPDVPKNPALAFYWQTNFSAILGAPLLSSDGKLVALNTIRHPEEDKVFLSIPTIAIATYLGFDPDASAKKETPPK